MEEIKIFAPATVANLSCGFDVLGCCLDSVGDEMLLRKNSVNKLRITRIEGANLPTDPDQNVAGVAAKALLKKLGSKQGFDIEIYKKIKPGSGLGSSAASAAGAVFAINKLLDSPFSAAELVEFAMKGEELASGNAHADNVAPALLGGFSLIRSYEPLEVINLPAPEELKMLVLHPQIEIKTKDSRAILKQQVSLQKAVSQWGNLAALVSALYTNNYELMSRSLVDGIIEPVRSILIPHFEELKKISLENGALGFGISGSGPSVFILGRGEEATKKLQQKIDSFYTKTGLDFELHYSAINQQGIRILS
ncbi:homoserine kinase [Salegentibacter sp. HM20]